MPYGGGTFSLVHNFTTEAASPPIEIAKLDAQFNDIATALSNCILRDGTGLPVTSISFNGQKITGLGNATADADALNRITADGRYAQLGAASNTFTGSAVRVSSSQPNFELYETDGALNNKLWSIAATGERLGMFASLDDGSSGIEFFTVNRTGTVIDSIALLATVITVNGIPVSDFARLAVPNTFLANPTVEGADPIIFLNELGGTPPNDRLWAIHAESAGFSIDLVNDAKSAFVNAIRVSRSGNTATAIALTATAVTVNGVSVNNAGILTAGTLPDARFPATLPALSGINLTNLNATNIVSGTLAAARLHTTVDSGTYTPALVGVTNVASTTSAVCQYLRIGNVVTVSGSVQVTCTSGAAVATELGISLPIASDFTIDTDCGGAGQHFYQSTGIGADATNNRAEVYWLSGTTNGQLRFSFTYRVK